MLGVPIELSVSMFFTRSKKSSFFSAIFRYILAVKFVQLFTLVFQMNRSLKPAITSATVPTDWTVGKVSLLT